MLTNRAHLIALLVILVVSAGCSGTSSPVQTDLNSPGYTANSEIASSNRILWGLYDCTMEPGSDEITVIPIRTAEFTANVNNLVEANPGNLIISNIDVADWFTEGRIDCTISLRHPFPGLDQYNGFDVWGVFMHNGSSTLAYDSLAYTDAAGGDGLLLNSDGYTRWFNYFEFRGTGLPLLRYFEGRLSDLPAPTAALNGFRIFADGLGAEDEYYEWITSETNINDRGIFTAGSVNSRRYQLQFPMAGGEPFLRFQYAVVATWEPGDPALTGNPVVYDPMDFPPDANCDEAFFIQSDDADSTLYNNGSGQSGGGFSSDIEVFDWQGGIMGQNGVPNEIARIIMEADFLPGGSVEWDQGTLASIAQPGTIASSVFQIDITGCTPGPVPSQEYWLIIESGGQFGDSYDQGFPSPFPQDAHRAAFYRGSVDISGTIPMGLEVVSIDPDTVPFYSQVDDAVITGSDFVSGCTVELRMDADIVPATDVVFQSSTSLLADFDLIAVESGLWDVVVINPSMEEGILEDGLTIDPWSEEILLEENGNRLPQIAETSDGEMVLAVGCNDSTMDYFTWADSWNGPYTLATRGSHSQIYLTSDPVNDYLYLSCSPTSTYSIFYRYTGGTGPWDERNSNFWSAKHCVAWSDLAGQLHASNSTVSAYGHLVHVRANDWNSSWQLPPQWYPDGGNDKEFTWGNFWAIDSTGRAYTAYEKDLWKNPYSPGTGRYIRIGWIPNASNFGGYANIESSMIYNNYLDSPAVAVDSSNHVWCAYRMYDGSQWRVALKESTSGGSSWGSASYIWSTSTEIMEDFTFLHCDSNDILNALVGIGDYLEYKYSADGTTWSDAETVNESAENNPPGTTDFMPMMMVASNGIMHCAWIRGTESTGYGTIYHRFRDID